jgi:quinol monooxygenase YgiN
MPQNDEVHIFATLAAKPGQADALRAILLDLVAATRAEPGALVYLLHEDQAVPGSFYFFETYKNQAAADAHTKTPHLAAALAKAEPLLASPLAFAFTRPAAGS